MYKVKYVKVPFKSCLPYYQLEYTVELTRNHTGLVSNKADKDSPTNTFPNRNLNLLSHVI